VKANFGSYYSAQNPKKLDFKTPEKCSYPSTNSNQFTFSQSNYYPDLKSEYADFLKRNGPEDRKYLVPLSFGTMEMPYLN
jgi:hypothetical protein